MEQPATHPKQSQEKPPSRIACVLGHFLPRRFRRWYVYLPLDAILILCIIVTGILVYSCFITGDDFFQTQRMSEDVSGQWSYLTAMVERTQQGHKFNIYDGYSPICGQYAEWDPIFYTFYAMALVEIHKAYPEQQGEIEKQLTWCARSVLRIPQDLDPGQIEAFLQMRQYGHSY